MLLEVHVLLIIARTMACKFDSLIPDGPLSELYGVNRLEETSKTDGNVAFSRLVHVRWVHNLVKQES